MTREPSPRALVYVQHLLGIGHLARIARVAGGLTEAGISVTIACGGPAEALVVPDGAALLQLPPVRVASHDMSTLLHPDGRPFEAADRASRRDLLLAALERLRPDILVIEAFPFGRRAMRFELLPLLEAAERLEVPVVASSIRDILQESGKPGRAEETAAVVERFFDIVLVHGEESVTPLALTFPLAGRISGRLRYTGPVGPPPIGAPVRDHEVIVSAGGGAVGAALLRAAIAARPLTAFAEAPWLVLSGPNLPDEDYTGLERAAAASPGIDLRRHVADLPARLAGAAMSVSQAGYNTVAEIEAAGCPAVLAPFAAGGETEQSLRAAALQRAGRAVMVAEAELTPERLAAAIAAARASPRAAPRRFDGAVQSAAFLLASLAERRHAAPYETRRATA